MGVFSDLKPKNHAVRNGFDRSQRHVFSAKFGRIKPSLVLPTLPSSEYDINLRQLCRTQPLQKAAFTGFSLNYDFIFVPYNHLYTSFNQFIAQRENKHLVNQPSSSVIPTFPLGGFLHNVILGASWDYYMASIFTNYQIFIEYVSNKFTNVLIDPDFGYSDAPFYLAYTNNAPQDSLYLKVIDQLDCLGYGNYLPYVKQIAKFIGEQLDLEGGTSDPQANYVWWLINLVKEPAEGQEHPFASVSASIADIIEEACSSFANNGNGYLYNLVGATADATVTYQPNLWPALAYNKAFYEYYRNTYYDSKVTCVMYVNSGYDIAAFGDDDSGIDYVYLFNHDDFEAGYYSVFGNIVYFPNGVFYNSFNACRLLLMFNQYNRPYKKDLVTSCMPSTQFGNVSTMVTDDNFRQLLITGATSSTSFKTIGSALPNGQIGPIKYNPQLSTATPQFKFDPALAISVLEMRKADALQRFRERMMRAGDKTKDIFVAHGWSEPKSEGSFEPVFLGSYDGSLDINTVAATVENEQVELGQLGANGVAVVNGSNIHFKCSDFGVVICNFYAVKNAEYDAYQLERHLQLTEPFDFPYPEIQNISLQPVTYSQVNAVNIPANPNLVLGYLPSFIEYKTNIDRVHDEFYSSNPAVPGVTSIADYDPTYGFVPGVFSDWVTPRQSVMDARSLAYLYQQIDIADNIFKLKASSIPSTNPLLINAYFDIKAVQPLTVIGLPL